MKVILLQDVAKIGRKHTITDVPDGYGQNQLIPKGLAKPATPENLKLVERLKAEKGAAASAAAAEFFATKKALEDVRVTLRGRKHDNGHLFAAIKPEEVVAAAAAAGVVVPKHMIIIPAAIKTTGEHEVLLSHGAHQFRFLISIE